MTGEERERLRSFLAGLRDLCALYGYKIGGCGCCGSPWVIDINDRTYGECLSASADGVGLWCDGEEVTDER